jgi:hypothetical protein
MMRLLLLTVLLVLSASAQTQYVGPGATTATCIDWDADGYGVGPSCEGPDADDGDAAIQTSAHGIATYGTFLAFLQHLGYNPTRIWYFDPVAGNDANSCRVAAGSFDPATTPRCQNYGQKSPVVSANAALGGFAAGDMFLFRGGTMTGRALKAVMACTSSARCTFLVYPGETFLIDYAGAGNGVDLKGNSPSYRCGSSTAPCTLQYEDYAPDQLAKHVTIDGFTVTNSSRAGQGIEPTVADHITIRNCHVYGMTRGIYSTDGITNLTISKNVVHDNLGSHSIYLGSRSAVARNVTVSGNILYNASLPHYQFNGRGQNVIFEQNIIWGDTGSGTSGIALMMGGGTYTGYTSYIRSNLVYGMCNNPLQIVSYPDPANGIYSWPITDYVIEGNTFVFPRKCSATGSDNGSGEIITFDTQGTSATIGETDPTNYGGQDVTTNVVIRNNMLVNESTSAGGLTPFIKIMARSSTYNAYTGAHFGAITPQIRAPDGFDFRTYGIRDPRTEAARLTIKNNYFYAPNMSWDGTLLRALNCNANVDQVSCSNFGGETPLDGYGTLTYISQKYTDLSALNAANTGNVILNANPLFTHVTNTDSWQPPFRYNYSLQPASTAIGAGTTSTAVLDLAGVARSSPPSIGAYEGATGSTVPTPPTITGSSLLASGITGFAYSATLTANGSTPITWSATGLPAGLSLSSSGVLSGTPTMAGFSTISVTATNGISPDATRDYTLTITAAPNPPTIITTSLPGGLVGVDYSQTLSAEADADSPTSWSVTAGTLPSGLSLSSVTGAISGTPDASGSATFTVTATNISGSDSQELTIAIGQAALFNGISFGGFIIR